MSFREKSAWISFVVILVAFGAYFASISVDLRTSMNTGYRGAPLLGLVSVIVVVTLIEVAAHLALAVRSLSMPGRPAMSVRGSSPSWQPAPRFTSS